VSSTYSGDLRQGDPLLHIPKHTAGATLGYSWGPTAVNLAMTYVGSWTEYDYVALFGYYFGGQPYRGAGRDYWKTYPSFTKVSLSATQALNDRLSLFVRCDNLTNKNVSEVVNYFMSAGRVTMIGLRTRL
jgi:outer membrane receptor for ferrienterochelin and colicin